MEYKVVSDEHYFNRFVDIAARVLSLAGLFQNQDTITTDQELIEWQDAADKLESELSELIYEAQYRIKEF
ncbi:hypothetical protein GCM10023310_69520 [Paenibacillus vulneris]|uniref:Uncharacterized protein n=1 Tax=Paenibacillus vulneris TaxID=1133364 RepID=A0ABW3UH26_9BACL